MALSIKALNPPSVWQVPDAFTTIYSHAALVSGATDHVYVSGQFGIAPDGHLPSEFTAQAALAMDNVEAILAAAGMSKSNIVKLSYFLTRPADTAALGALRRERWPSHEPPAVTALVVSALARPEYLIEIEAVAAK